MSEIIKLAMLGMVDGNGHPYSWSAIFNGYNREKMAKCPYAGIPEYLNKQPKETFGIAGAKVEYVWTPDPADAVSVAEASLVPNILEKPEDAIGKADAVIIATDIGHQHVDMCRPFIEANLPIFVDKPLVDNEADLQTICSWADSGKRLMSSSCMRYSKEFLPYRISTHDLGELRYAGITTPKTWERYGIHALEAIYPILKGGFISCQNIGSIDKNIVHYCHQSGADVVVAAELDMYGGFGMLTLCGTASSAQVAFKDTYFAFKSQLEAFIQYLQTGVTPFAFAETIELMKMLIAGIVSREQGGRRVSLSEIKER